MQPGIERLQFGPFVLDTAARQLIRDGQAVHLAPKTCDVLLLLLQHSGHVIDKDEILRAVWPDVSVEEGNLAQHISLLRKTLGEGPDGGAYIETVPKSGYRFLVPVIQAPPTPSRAFARRTVDVALAAAALSVWAWGFYWLGQQRSTFQPQSIWVVPFANLTGDAARQPLCDRLQAEVLAEIRQFTGYRVSVHSAPADASRVLLCKGRLLRSGDLYQLELAIYDRRQANPAWQFSDTFPAAGEPETAVRARAAIHAYLHSREHNSVKIPSTRI